MQTAREERVDTVGRREHQPSVVGQVGKLELERLHRDRRQLDHLGAELDEPGAQAARLLAGTGRRRRAGRTAVAARTSRGRAPRPRRRRSRTEPRPVRSPIVASVLRIVRWCGCVPQRTAATGVSGARPPSMSSRATSATRPAPISTTSVPPARASASQSVSDVALGRVFVTGDDRDVGREPAVGHRDAGVRGRGDRARDAGHDLERHARRDERLGFFAAAAEHERVAALQPHDGRAGAPALDEQPVDVGLTHRDASRRLPDVDALGASRGARSSSRGDASRSCTTTSARASSSAPRTVSSPGSPGPAPTR